MFSKLLVPLDGSPEAAAALRVACSLAHLTRGELVLVRIANGRLTEAESYLANAAAEVEAEGVAVSRVIGHGDAATGIDDVARAQHADAIVMVTRGRSGLVRTGLGSVAERLLSHGSVPLLLLHTGTHSPEQLRNLLVPLDGSPGAAMALGIAVALVQASDGHLTLTQVVEPIPRYAYVENYVDPSWDEQALQAAEAYVQGMVTRLRRANVHAEGHAVLAPHVARQISAEAERVDADLVIMSTHAHRGVARTVMGSVADALVRTAKRPVLLVHENPHR